MKLYTNKLRYGGSVPVFGASAGTHYAKMYFDEDIVLGYEEQQPINYEAEYFTITNLESTNITVDFRTYTGTSYLSKIAYMKSTENTWTEITRNATTMDTMVTLGVGESVKFKGQGTSWQNSPYPTRYSNHGNVDATGRFSVSGNLWSLLYWDSFYGATIRYTQGDMWSCLFQSKSSSEPNHCTDAYNLVLVPSGCTVTSPGAFSRLFQDNPYIRRSPLLNLTIIPTYGYWSMFTYCTALEEVRCTATSGINSNNSTGAESNQVPSGEVGWMGGAKSGGTFYKAANATWPRAAYGIPSSWTVVDYVA